MARKGKPEGLNPGEEKDAEQDREREDSGKAPDPGKALEMKKKNDLRARVEALEKAFDAIRVKCPHAAACLKGGQ